VKSKIVVRRLRRMRKWKMGSWKVKEWGRCEVEI